MPINGESIVSEAKTWIGTPWSEVVTQKGPHGGVDCSHLVWLVYGALGCHYPYTQTGGFPPAGYFTSVEESQSEAGDVVLFVGHMGIIAEKDDNDIISAQGSKKKPGIVQFGQSTWFGPVRGYYRWTR